MQRITYTSMSCKTAIRLVGVARNQANGFPARLLGQERLHRQPPYQRPRRDGSRSPQISDRKDPARCLVLSAGSYEWRRVGNRRIPMRIVMKSGKPLAIASPWDTWRGPKEGIVKACTIITLQWRAFWERSIRN